MIHDPKNKKGTIKRGFTLIGLLRMVKSSFKTEKDRWWLPATLGVVGLIFIAGIIKMGLVRQNSSSHIRTKHSEKPQLTATSDNYMEDKPHFPKETETSAHSLLTFPSLLPLVDLPALQGAMLPRDL